MIMNRVSSSKLVAVGYDASAMILRVELKNATYEYYNVPEHVYKGLMSAPSHGCYYSAYIKNAHRHQRVH